MTCVVGLVEKGRVHIGVDSAAVSGWTRRQTTVRKVFRRGPFLIGYTTSFRMGQLLQHQLVVPPQATGQADMEYMVNHFIEAVRALFKERGFAKVEASTESGGQFLVGYRNHLYAVEKDFQVGEMVDGYDAVGSGSDFALGAMKVLEGVAPARRIRRSLEAAAHFSMAVCPPFFFKSMKT